MSEGYPIGVEVMIGMGGWKAVSVFALVGGERKLYHNAIYAPETRLDFCRAHGREACWFPVGHRCPACSLADRLAEATARRRA